VSQMFFKEPLCCFVQGGSGCFVI